MKTQKIIIFVTMLISIILLNACNDDHEAKINLQKINSLSLSNKTAKEFYIIYVEWDEFGRTSRNCKGFGLCNFSSCSFCCLQDGVIVNCNKQNKISNSGRIVIDKISKVGHLTIELDSSDLTHLEAIKNKNILYIDKNLINQNITLKKGEYSFNKSIGLNGGYIIHAVMK